jgi:hypothetical protein
MAIADNINILGNFCSKRDIPVLTTNELYKKYGIGQADVMVLFGGSIPCGGDVLAQAMQNNIAKKYIIVGGEGHTTASLRMKMNTKMVSKLIIWNGNLQTVGTISHVY